MRKEVPQFIDIKDKIFGPLTFDQFIYLVGGAGLIYAIIRFVPLFLIKALLVAGVGGLSIALAFAKYNGRPFVYSFQAFIMYLFKTKKYLYKPRVTSGKDKFKQETENALRRKLIAEVPIKELNDAKLQALSRGLDTWG